MPWLGGLFSLVVLPALCSVPIDLDEFPELCTVGIQRLIADVPLRLAALALLEIHAVGLAADVAVDEVLLAFPVLVGGGKLCCCSRFSHCFVSWSEYCNYV